MNEHLKYEIHWQRADTGRVFQAVFVSEESAMRVYGEKLPRFVNGEFTSLSVRKWVQCDRDGVHKLDWITDARMIFKEKTA